MTTAVVSNILVTSENPRHLPDDGSGFQIVAEQDTFTSTVGENGHIFLLHSCFIL